MHALVHRETCIRCGLCPNLCPEVFDLPDGESAQIIADPVPEDCRAIAQEAADSCPVGAIHIS
jgi:ferredoxin